jgi:hypothetical protein
MDPQSRCHRCRPHHCPHCHWYPIRPMDLPQEPQKPEEPLGEPLEEPFERRLRRLPSLDQEALALERSWLAVLPRQCPARLACPSRQSRPCCQSRPSRSSRCCCPSLFCRCPSVLQRGSARHLRSAASCPRNTAGLLLAAIPSGGLPEPSGIEQCRCCRARQQHQGHHVAGAALLHYDSPFLKRNTIKTRPICCQKMKWIFH